MHIEFLHRPGNTAARVTLDAGEQLTAESGAMIAMSGSLGMTTTTHKKDRGGVLKGLKRLVAGESFFLNHFEATRNNSQLWLGTSLAGDMMEYPLDGETLVVQGGSYIASEQGVEVNLGWQGFKSVLSGERVFWLHLNGRGKAILGSFGAIYPVEVDGEYIVDTGHIVAFNETLDFSLTKAGKSWISSLLGGEGLVCKFRGKGTVWCQSHNTSSFGGSLTPSLRPRKV